MKKALSLVLFIAMVLSVMSLAACGPNEPEAPETYEIAVVTDVGQLMDKGFNQGTWEGAEAYAKANNKTVKYYQPANGSDATDNDRIAAMRQAITNGAKIIVAPGFLQAAAMTTVAIENPEVKFVFIDGWDMGYPNLVGVSYQEEQAGYLAGYAAVKDGMTKLGFMGAMAVPAVQAFGYGYLQGADAAAKELGVDVEATYHYTGNFDETYKDVVRTAAEQAKSGDIVVLSPASTSFDMFANFEERGKTFKNYVNEL